MTTHRPPFDLCDGLSVDVEDYFHVEAFATSIPRSDWPVLPFRVADNTKRLLEILSRHSAHATFFILGWVAERDPALVREISNAGHEIGCHSYGHYPLWRLSPSEFREDSRRALDSIQQACGQKVYGYRAPTFSVVHRTLWALEILCDLGFEYDSSVFPCRHDSYGMPDSPRSTFEWDLNGKTLYEIPMSTSRFLGTNWPAGGGGYLRILPMVYNRWVFKRIRKVDKKPCMLYLHPWEIDPEQPRVKAPAKSRLRHYLNLGSMEGRLTDMLRRHRFTTLTEVLRNEIGRGRLPTKSLPSIVERSSVGGSVSHS